MGQFVNPGDGAFADEVNSEIYVDKTGLIRYTNSVCDTAQKYVCNSRPRRFGKSYAANMLAAYYSKGCDSKALFRGLEISRDKGFDTYLNKCQVIHLDIQWFFTTLSQTGDVRDIVGFISRSVIDELTQEFPDVDLTGIDALSFALSRINAQTGERFVIIIDEWDVLIRDEIDTAIQDGYIMFLRSLFKGAGPSRYLRLAYMTGILPIKKLKTESALNDFDEFTMIFPGFLTPCIGFTDEEVRALCARFGRDYGKMRQWYDGYILDDQHIYNPRAVVAAARSGTFTSYWSDSGSYESVVPLIQRDFDGLKAAVISMLSGDAVPVDTASFRNDVASVSNRDDVLTLLIHLGYLAYDQRTRMAFVPNDEVRGELGKAVRRTKWTEFDRFLDDSQRLLDATLAGDGDTVADAIGRIHDTYASMITYNNENSLSSVLTIGYLSTLKCYFSPIREMPFGRGFADFIYVPRPECRESHPALVVELKWNKDVRTALDQIREKRYAEPLKDYTGDVLLVGITYDRKTKHHACSIKRQTF